MEDESLLETINDTDGLVWGLYHHLWLKTHKGLPCPDINIPHTVVYQDTKPVAWYFTSLKDNKIYRKNKGNLLGSQIAEAMTSGKEVCGDACAWLYGTTTQLAPSSPRKMRRRLSVRNEDDDEPDWSFHYLSTERVQLMIAPGQYTVPTEELHDGVLQRMVAPREPEDSLIRVMWSPTSCVCERRTNRHVLANTEVPLAERIASFEVDNFWLNTHTQLPAGSVLCDRLQSTCGRMVSHLREVSNINVAFMEVFFKVDSVNRIWLLYCNSIRLDRTTRALTRTPSARGATRSFALKDPTGPKEDASPPVDDSPFLCALTGATCPGRERVDVTYKLLIQHWFTTEVSALANESDRIQAMDAIPPSLRRANPNITREYYLKMRAQPVFLLRTAPCCNAAASQLSNLLLADLARTISKPEAALGILSTTGKSGKLPRAISTAPKPLKPFMTAPGYQGHSVPYSVSSPAPPAAAAAAAAAEAFSQTMPPALIPRPAGTPPTSDGAGAGVAAGTPARPRSSSSSRISPSAHRQASPSAHHHHPYPQQYQQLHAGGGIVSPSARRIPGTGSSAGSQRPLMSSSPPPAPMAAWQPADGADSGAAAGQGLPPLPAAASGPASMATPSYSSLPPVMVSIPKGLQPYEPAELAALIPTTISKLVKPAPGSSRSAVAEAYRLTPPPGDDQQQQPQPATASGGTSEGQDNQQQQQPGGGNGGAPARQPSPALVIPAITAPAASSTQHHHAPRSTAQTTPARGAGAGRGSAAHHAPQHHGRMVSGTGAPYISGRAAGASGGAGTGTQFTRDSWEHGGGGGDMGLDGSASSRHSRMSLEDFRTLKELSDAYTQAELVTRSLLAQAHELLSEQPQAQSPGGSSSEAHPGPAPGAGLARVSAQPGHAGSGSSRGVSRPASARSGAAAPADAAAGAEVGGSSGGRPSSAPRPGRPSSSSSGQARPISASGNAPPPAPSTGAAGIGTLPGTLPAAAGSRGGSSSGSRPQSARPQRPGSGSSSVSGRVPAPLAPLPGGISTGSGSTSPPAASAISAATAGLTSAEEEFLQEALAGM